MLHDSFYSFSGANTTRVFSPQASVLAGMLDWGISQEEISMDISDIHRNMEHVNIEGEIVNFNRWMIVIDDKSGRIFVRHNRSRRTEEEWQKMLEQIKIGNLVSIQDCYSVNYSGIIQLKLSPKGRITLLQLENMEH